MRIFRLFSNDSFDLLKGGLNHVAILRTSRQCQSSQYNCTVTGSGDRDFAAEFKSFMSFAFGNTTDMGFVKAIKFTFIGFVLKKDVPGIQQGLGIRTDLFLGHFADQFTNQVMIDGLQSSYCLPGLLFLLRTFQIRCLTKELGVTLD